jgi:hypothetical protein
MSPESYLQSLTHKQYTIERLSALETSTRNSKKNFDFFKENGLAKEKYCIHCKKTTLINEDSGGKQTCSQCGKEYTN